MDIPHIISHCAIFISVLGICFGIYVLRLNPGLKLYRIFFILCIVSSISAFSSGLMICADNKQIIVFWSRIGITGCILVTGINLHFTIIFTKIRLNNLIITALYLPAAIAAVFNLTKYPIISDFIKYGDFWKFIPEYNFINIFFMVYSSLYIFASVLLFYRKLRSRSSTLHKEHLQLKTILISCIPIWITLSVTDYILPPFEFYHMIPLGPFGRIIYIYIVWFALVRYRFLLITPSIVADEIISHIDDMVLVLTPELKIMTANNTCQELLFKNNKNYLGRDLFDFAYKDDDIITKINGIINDEMNNCNCGLNYKSGNELIITDTYASRIVDKFSDFIGILVISKENRKLKQLQKLYSLSDRQIEVIESCMAGLNNDEISRKLRISKKTTESHFCNIYNKLGINNRIELFNVIKDFEII